MDYTSLLDDFQKELRFLELKKDLDLGVFSLPAGLSVPLSSEDVIKKAEGELNFSIKNILQNMMVLVSLCEDFSLNHHYDIVLRLLFNKLEIESILAVIDVDSLDSLIKKAGVLKAYAKYKPCMESYLSQAKAFFMLYDNTKEEELLQKSERSFLTSLEYGESSEAYYFLTYIYDYKEEYKKARDYANKYLTCTTDELEQKKILPELNYLLTMCDVEEARELMEKGRYQECLDILEVNRYVDNYLRSRVLGECYIKLGLLEEALKHLKHALELKNDHAETYYLIGLCSGRLGDLTNAIRFFETALKLEPLNVRYIKPVADGYIRTGREDRAEKLLKKARDFSPDDLEVLQLLEWIRARAENEKTQ